MFENKYKRFDSMKKISIIFSDIIGNIAPEIYGHFSEHIGGVIYGGIWVGKDSDIPNIKGWRKDFIEKFKKINPPVLRWPGGCFAETYHWRDGIGENRPTRPNWWGFVDGKYEPNEVGTHEFMDLCEILNTKPYFAVNITSITPMEARDWMDYCLSPRGATTLALEREANGHPEPFDIPYWGVGNENWGDGGNMTPDYYALEYRRFAAVLNNLKRKEDKLFVGGANAADYFWTHDVCQNLSTAKCTKFDGLTYHFYARPGVEGIDFDENGWNTIIEVANKMDYLIKRNYAIAQGFGLEKNMKLVVDEWGCWYKWGSGPSKGKNLFEQQSTVRDAVVSALTLNIFNNNCDKVQMANVAQVCNNLHALFLADENNFIETPTYYVFDMFKGHQGGNALKTVVSNNAELENSVSVSSSIKDDVLTITLANLSCKDDAEISLDLLGNNREITSSYCVILQGKNITDYNTFENPHTVIPECERSIDITKPLTLPKASVMLIKTNFK